jgi:hypothetical protein
MSGQAMDETCADDRTSYARHDNPFGNRSLRCSQEQMSTSSEQLELQTTSDTFDKDSVKLTDMEYESTSKRKQEI